LDSSYAFQQGRAGKADEIRQNKGTLKRNNVAWSSNQRKRRVFNFI